MKPCSSIYSLDHYFTLLAFHRAVIHASLINSSYFHAQSKVDKSVSSLPPQGQYAYPQLKFVQIFIFRIKIYWLC